MILKFLKLFLISVKLKNDISPIPENGPLLNEKQFFFKFLFINFFLKYDEFLEYKSTPINNPSFFKYNSINEIIFLILFKLFPQDNDPLSTIKSKFFG